MRLINTSTFEFLAGEPAAFKSEGYAILSHRWVGLEITFDRLPGYVAELRKNRDRPVQPVQLDKIRGACQIARSQGMQWMWIDNCCINKTNAVEEAESINSMFRWYCDAKVCITYLGDVRSDHSAQGTDVFRSVETGRPSEWFTRGWTLQELLAPANMQFYDMNWEFIGMKKNLAPALHQITGISTQYLTGEENFQTASIAAKMSWLAGRQTARPEDIAYSMLGLLDVNMTPQYGEGAKRAFMRLQHTVMLSSPDESLYAWKMPAEGPGSGPYKLRLNAQVTLEDGEWGLLAPSPDWFKGCGRITATGAKGIVRPFGGFESKQQGVSAPIPKNESYVVAFIAGFTLIGAIPWYIWYFYNKGRPQKFTLNCWEPDEAGKLMAVQIYLKVKSKKPRAFVRMRSREYRLVSGRAKNGDPEPTVVLQPE